MLILRAKLTLTLNLTVTKGKDIHSLQIECFNPRR